MFKAVAGDESADVFWARDLADDAAVRVRLVRPSATDAIDRVALLRSIGRAIDWHHPAALPIREAGIDGDRLYVVTERPRGAPLAERLANGEPGALPWAATIVDGALAAVEAAIVAGIAHTGLSPDNIFTTPYLSVEVGDFGLPMLPAVSATATPTVPAAIFLRPTDAQPGWSASITDQLYAAAALLIWLAGGRPPFDGATIDQVQRRHQSKLAPSLATFADAPEPLVAAVARCLRKDPAGRPRSIAVLRDALALVNPTALAVAPAEDPTPPPVRSRRRWFFGLLPRS